METTTFISSFVAPQAAAVPGPGSAAAVGGAHLRPRLLGPALLPHRPAQVMDCWDWELGLPTNPREFSRFLLEIG